MCIVYLIYVLKFYIPRVYIIFYHFALAHHIHIYIYYIYIFYLIRFDHNYIIPSLKSKDLGHLGRVSVVHQNFIALE